MATSQPQTPLALFGTDELIGEEDRAIRDTVRRHVEDKLKPAHRRLVRVGGRSPHAS